LKKQEDNFNIKYQKQIADKADLYGDKE